MNAAITGIRRFFKVRLRTTTEKVLILFVPAILLLPLGLFLGFRFDLWRINQPYSVSGDKYLVFEPRSNDVVEISAPDLVAEISSWHPFELTGPRTYTSEEKTIEQIIMRKTAMYLPSDFVVKKGPMIPGKYQISSPEYWSNNGGIQFELWSSGPIEVKATRSDYNVPFGLDATGLNTLFGGAGAAALGFVLGLFTLFKLTPDPDDETVWEKHE